MGRTNITSPQIRDGEVKRVNVNTSEAGAALLRKLIAGDLISISSTGTDPGTGDVTVNFDDPTALNGQILTKTASGFSFEDPTGGSDAPIGTIVPYAGSSAPYSYLMCDGSAVDRGVYSELFSVIGETFGAGNGTTTFNIPDLRQKHPVGAKSGDFDLGDTVDSANEQLLTGTVSTSDATETTCLALTIPDNHSLKFSVEVSARYDNTGTEKSYWAKIEGGVRRNNGSSAVLVGTRTIVSDDEGTPGYSADVDVSGNDLRVRVTGAAAEDVDWNAKIRYITDDGTGDVTQTTGTTEGDSYLAVNYLIKHTIANVPQSLTPNKVVVTDGAGTLVTSGITLTELNYLSGLSSNIQTQIDNKYDSSNFITSEVPTGLINGSNTTYVLSSTPVVGSQLVFKNGMLEVEGGGADYTISGDTITYNTAPLAGDVLVVCYQIA